MATILLVDNERILRTLLGIALRNRNHVVLESATVRGALSRAGRRHDIHLLIADIALRGANGLELQRALRVQRPALRAVFLSRYPHAVALEDEARSAGESVLREPFDIQSLLARVEEALHGQARKPPERAVESAASKPAAQLRR